MADIGRRVMVIHQSRAYYSDDQPFPPIGAVGVVVSEFDECGECDVMFSDYPCQTPADPTWIVHYSMVVFIDDDERVQTVSWDDMPWRPERQRDTG